MAANAKLSSARTPGTSQSETPVPDPSSPPRRSTVGLGSLKSVLFALVVLSPVACKDSPTATEPRGLVRGQVTVDGVGVPALLLFSTPGIPPAVIPGQTDGSGNYEVFLDPGDWSVSTNAGAAACPAGSVTILDGGEATRNVPCQSIAGRHAITFHQVAGTCNDPISDFTQNVIVSASLDGDRYPTQLRYENGNDNTTVTGEYDPATNQFSGVSGLDDAGNGVGVRQISNMTFMPQAGGLKSSGTFEIEFVVRLNGQKLCSKTFTAGGDKYWNQSIRSVPAWE